MEKLSQWLVQPEFWFSTVVGGVLINLFSSWLWGYIARTSRSIKSARRERFTRLVDRLRQEQPFVHEVRYRVIRQRVGAVLYAVAYLIAAHTVSTNPPSLWTLAVALMSLLFVVAIIINWSRSSRLAAALEAAFPSDDWDL